MIYAPAKSRFGGRAWELLVIFAAYRKLNVHHYTHPLLALQSYSLEYFAPLFYSFRVRICVVLTTGKTCL